MRIIKVPLICINLQDEGYHLVIEINIFGKPQYAVLDTGASRSVFDKTLMEQHIDELVESSENQAATIFSSAVILQGTIPVLKIGKLTLKNYETVALDLQSVTDTYLQLGHPRIAGIIGGDILMRYGAKIDYRKNSMSLYK